MTFLLVLGGIVAALALYLVDRVIKARGQAQRLRKMTTRLAAATARADEQQVKRRAAVAASGALTSMVPAIKHPALAGGEPDDQPGQARDEAESAGDRDGPAGDRPGFSTGDAGDRAAQAS